MSIFLIFLSSCEKDELGGANTLDVIVKFNGTEKPIPGNILTVVVYYSDVTELDFQADIEPDVTAPVLLTQDMIDNGVTVNLDTINLDESKIYVGAFVDRDGDMTPSLGDLVEFYQNVPLWDAFFYDVLLANAYGFSSIEIDLDEILTIPSLEVTINFTGNTVPETDDVLHIAVFYGWEDIDADDEYSYTLTADDILNGVTLLVYNPIPLETELYIGVYVDSDGNNEPSQGELIECYEDKDFAQVISGAVNADNVINEKSITINLDIILEI